MNLTKILAALLVAGFWAAAALGHDGKPTAVEKPQLVRPLLVGASIPAATLTAHDGTEVDLAAEVQKQPAVLVFYRGGW